MTTSKPFVFYSSTAEMLANVLDDAWRELIDNRDPRVLNRSLTRDQVAARIMQSALLGERNPIRLKAEAM
jgi:hypothetical protein